MTDNAEFPYRLAVGWISKAALEANDAYLLSAFPVQSDQFSVYINPWFCIDDANSRFPAYTRYGQYSNTTQWSDGPTTFAWSLKYLTEGMVLYLEGLLWGGLGMYPDTATQSSAVTVKTRRADGLFSVFQGYANKPVPDQNYKRGYRGVEDYRITFVSCSEIFA